MTKNLPTEVILSILNLLPSELDKFSFASVNKRHWRICSSPTVDILKLESSITALQLRKYCTFIVQERYYDKKYLKHVFLHAASLHTIALDDRQKCTFDFALFLLRSANMNKKVTFIVPERFERKFKCIVEEDEMDHVTIKISGEEQLIDITKIVTPEAVRTQAERAKNILKRDYYLANKKTIVMKDNLSHMVASPINRFFNSKEYHVWKNDFGDDLLMKKTDLDAVEASRIVNEYGPKLVESVVVLEDHWFFITSFSCFIHSNHQIDDCADLSKVGHQEKAVAFIRRKTKLGKDYFELTYRFGYVELLATSGFFGSVDGTFFSPFLGSSVQELPAAIIKSFQTISTNVIFIAIEQKKYIRKNRIINQYYKPNAKNNWGFYSKRYEDNGFSPANPLSFESQHIMHSAASFVIKSFAYQKIQQEKMEGLLLKVLAQDDLSLNSVSKLIKKYLVFLNQHRNSSFSLSPPKETKKELIEIYNNSLASVLKSSNIKNIKLAKKRYAATKIDLFGEE
ncbi:hypothetical protein CU098_007295 [Rhizopus stolonifer]|uniref:F-box domain-containing protein n=1 Tax=Rhizopus stolonifer TaxID=4846 RepID=A0A367JEA6_RHIST|nr:hypothetical protein CU098_007295 [Rhizopus stolonifer]